MSELIKKFNNSHHLSEKWEKYFHVYEFILSKYKNKSIIFVEIGIHNGGSLKMWKDYFGTESKIIGIDVNKDCKKFENKNENIEVYIGNQSDVKFWKSFFDKVGPVDVILDDGGHTNLDQIITTIQTIPHIKDEGVLIVEDTHTSYMDIYNSNPKYTFINFVKRLIDNINCNINLELNIKTNSDLNNKIYSIQIFESIVAFFIDRKKNYKNYTINNFGNNSNIKDLTWITKNLQLGKAKKFFDLLSFFSFNKIKRLIINNKINNLIKKHFY